MVADSGHLNVVRCKLLNYLYKYCNILGQTQKIEIPMDLRLYPRMYISLPMEYQVGLLESAKIWDGEGILKNLSSGGAYFTCDAHLPLETGDVRDFRFTATYPSHLNRRQKSLFKATGLVVRVDKPADGQTVCGFAVKFITGLQISQV